MTTLLFPDCSKLILRAGDALYGGGDDWMDTMADALGVRADTVRQWAEARRTPPVDVIERLQALATNRRTGIETLQVTIADATARMICPICASPLAVRHRQGTRLIECISGHIYLEDAGAPFGPFVEKKFHHVDALHVLLTAQGRHPQGNMSYTISRHCEDELAPDLIRVKVINRREGLTLDCAFYPPANGDLDLATAEYHARLKGFLETKYWEIASDFFQRD